jgi:hypothetical protein
MNTRRSGRSRSYVAVLLMAALPGLAVCANAPASNPTGPATSGSRAEAAAILKGMAEYLGGLSSFTCTSTNTFEVVQANGQKVEFGETRRISLARPDRLRIEEVASDGASDLALFDGKQITVLSADENVYAQAPQPPSLEDALVYFVRDLRMRMPLALMLSTHVKTELPAVAKEIDYVETSQIRGKTAHHLAGRGDSVDFEIWITDDKNALPVRIAITYKEAPDKPKFVADISDWNTSPTFPATTFQLSLPQGAKNIPFVVQMLQPTAAPQAAAGQVKP